MSDAETAPDSSRTATRHRIEIKVTAEQKDLIIRAAAARRQGISEFVRLCAETAANDILKRR